MDILIGVVIGMTLMPTVAAGLLAAALYVAGVCAVEMDRRSER